MKAFFLGSLSIYLGRSEIFPQLLEKNEQHERNICYALCQAGHFMGEDLPTKLSKTAIKGPKLEYF